MTNRVEYQKHWALCEILGRHERDEDYLFVFEIHDDIVIFDSAETPSKAEFCQVKTRAANRGHWTVKRLTGPDPDDADEEDNADGGEPQPRLSILGKLFDNRQRFPDETISLTVVSNAHFSLKLRDGVEPDLDTIPASALSDAVRVEILEHLRQAFGVDVTDADLETFRFQHCTLSLKDAPRHAMGVLHDFLDRRFPGRQLPESAIYTTLISEINRRTAREQEPADFAAMRRDHSLSRAEIESHLRVMSRASNPGEDLEDIKRRLEQAGWSWGRVRKLQNQWRDYLIKRTDPDNSFAQACREWIAPVVATVIARDTDIDPSAIVEGVNAILQTSPGRPSGLQQDYCDAVILFEAAEQIANPELSSPDSPPEEEAA